MLDYGDKVRVVRGGRVLDVDVEEFASDELMLSGRCVGCLVSEGNAGSQALSMSLSVLSGWTGIRCARKVDVWVSEGKLVLPRRGLWEVSWLISGEGDASVYLGIWGGAESESYELGGVWMGFEAMEMEGGTEISLLVGGTGDFVLESGRLLVKEL